MYIALFFGRMAMWLIALIVLGLMLSGCATREVIVTKTQLVLLEPPEGLLKDCDFAVPPSKSTYLGDKDEDIIVGYRRKESLLADFGKAQTTAVAMCNIDKKSLREWLARERENQKKHQKALK